LSKENFSQEVFDKMLEKYPTFENQQQALAEVVKFTICETYDQSKQFFATQLVSYLNDMWTVMSLQKVPKTLVAAVKRDPQESMRMAVTAVARKTVEVIAQLSSISLESLDSTDPTDEEVGDPKGTC